MKKTQQTFNLKHWLIPIVLAIPVIAAILFILNRYGETAKDLIHVAIKMAVVS